MIITMYCYQQIRELYLVQGMSKRAIARQLGISRHTVDKYCNGNVMPGMRSEYHRNSPVITDEVMNFIEQCLQEDALEKNRKQHHTARRIYDRLRQETGFTGSESTVRAAVKAIRGKVNITARVPLSFEPGEAMQIDFGHHVAYIHGKREKIHFFCARLCYSCTPFVMCFTHENTEAFLEGLLNALEFFGGVPRKVIFDNGSVAVQSGFGKNAIARECYQNFAAHYCFKTVFCNPASGNEKGLVEGLVGWARRNIFVPVPRVDDIQELNRKAIENCQQYIETHHIQSHTDSVKENFAQDKAKLLPLPGIRYDVSISAEYRVSNSLTVRFQTNSYSVPLEYTGKIVTVKATCENVTIIAGGKEIARHKRIYDKHKESLQLEHYLPLLLQRPRSILQARPVKSSLSPQMLELLNNCENSRKMVEILTAYVEKGEKFVLDNLYQPNKTSIKDDVVVEKVNLNNYDALIG